MGHSSAKSGGPGGGVNLGIIITPFLDTAFQKAGFKNIHFVMPKSK